MGITVRGIPELRAGLQEINDFLDSHKPMGGLVEDVKMVVLQKTAAGRDYMDSSFAPYSEQYAKKKEGMTATGGPNLKVSGTMLGAIQTEVISPTHGRVFVASVSEPGGKINSDLLADIHNKGTGKQPERQFMNINDSQLQAAKKKNFDDPLGEMAKKLR